LFFAAARKLAEEIEKQDSPQASIILSLRGVPLADATGIEVLRELWRRQQKSGGELLLAAIQPRVADLLRRSGFEDEIGRQRLFWSADRAILSLGAPLPGVPNTQEIAADGMDSAQVITPYEDRAETQI